MSEITKGGFSGRRMFRRFATIIYMAGGSLCGVILGLLATIVYTAIGLIISWIMFLVSTDSPGFRYLIYVLSLVFLLSAVILLVYWTLWEVLMGLIFGLILGKFRLTGIVYVGVCSLISIIALVIPGIIITLVTQFGPWSEMVFVFIGFILTSIPVLINNFLLSPLLYFLSTPHNHASTAA
jgi:hypothetical protein